jgi:CheY-like chemotaxis protein
VSPEPSAYEPQLGQSKYGKLSGNEPALVRDKSLVYGSFRIPGFEAPRTALRRRPSVIYADSDYDSTYLVEQIAVSNGYQITSITINKPDVSDLVMASPPDLIAINTNVGLMPCLNFITRVRSSKDLDLRQIAILVLDASGQPENLPKFFSAGADDALVAPYYFPQLIRAMRRNIGFRCHPAPLTAFNSEQQAVREAALHLVIDHPPEGLISGLIDLMETPDSTVQDITRTALHHFESAGNMYFANRNSV